MASSDKVQGVSGALAIKAPVRVATTANITLSGLQTIDGIALAAGDRVLVKDQTDTLENGIYAAAAGAWTRTRDFDGSGDVVEGTLITVSEGTVSEGYIFRADTDGGPGTDAVLFSVSVANIAAQLASAGSGEGASLVAIEDAGGHFAGGTVEAALQELGAEQDTQNTNIGNNSSAIGANAAAISANAAAISAHVSDTDDAHDASAISVAPVGNLASTNVQAALQELQGDVDSIVQFGEGQTWTNFTIGAGPTGTHRQAATLFTNSTGRSIMVNVTVSGTVATGTMDADLEVGGVIVARTEDVLGSSAHTDTLSAVVPDGGQYQITNVSQAAITFWTELR